MNYTFEINLTVPPDGMVATVEPAEGKVYVFVEPTPELLAVLDTGKPDELEGLRCVSFVLENERAYAQSKALTRGVIDAMNGGGNDPTLN